MKCIVFLSNGKNKRWMRIKRKPENRNVPEFQNCLEFDQQQLAKFEARIRQSDLI
jgi:hypothetical protein